MATSRVGVFRKWHGRVPTRRSRQAFAPAGVVAQAPLSLGSSLVRFGRDTIQPQFRRQKGGGTFRREETDWERIVGLVINHRRKVPVPRRTLRFLAGLSRPVAIATVLGHLLRCLYYRSGLCEPCGRCKASWIAEVFGVDVRNVKAARLHLNEIGWLVVQETHQTAMNRWGAAVTIQLDWSFGQSPPLDKPPPPPADSSAESPPPIENWELSSRMKNQKPARAVRSGACRKSDKPARLTNVTPEDLKTPNRLESLFVQARDHGLTQGGEAARLRFFAAAKHALRVGRRNPPGLFVSIIRRGLWSFISVIDEDAARQQVRLTNQARDGVSPPIGARVSRFDSLPTACGAVLQDVLCRLRFAMEFRLNSRLTYNPNRNIEPLCLQNVVKARAIYTRSNSSGTGFSGRQ